MVVQGVIGGIRFLEASEILLEFKRLIYFPVEEQESINQLQWDVNKKLSSMEDIIKDKKLKQRRGEIIIRNTNLKVLKLVYGMSSGHQPSPSPTYARYCQLYSSKQSNTIYHEVAVNNLIQHQVLHHHLTQHSRRTKQKYNIIS